MNLAELFVRVSGDTSDFTNKMGGAQRSLGSFGKSANDAHGGVGRLNNAMAGMATQVAGVNPILGKATEIIASLGLGSASVVTGALGGLALLAFAWDTITRSAREATKAQDDALKSAANMLKMKGAGAGGQNVLDLAQMSGMMQKLQQERAALVASDSARSGSIANRLGLPGAVGPSTERIAEIDEAMANLSAVMKATSDEIAKSIKARDLETLGKKARDEAEAHAKVEAALMKAQAQLISYNELMARTYGTLGTVGHDFSGGPMSDQLRNARNAALPSVLEALQGLDISAPQVGMPTVGVNDGLTKVQIQARDKLGILVDHGDRNSEMLAGAIGQSAAIIGGAVMNALNIGGGGKGSQLGGALGGVAGMVGGILLAPAGPVGMAIGAAIGSTIGNIAGSLIGGLFDHHKKAVDNNTQAVRQLTQALLQNTPSGFKIGQYRYAATDVKGIMNDFSKYKTRGGTVRLGT